MGREPCRGRIGATLLLAAGALAGCTSTRGAGPACCADAERFPPVLVALAEPAAPILGRALGSVVLRPGHLSRTPAAISHIMGRLRPLDLVMVSSKGRMSGQAVPGLFTHALLYLGDEAELRRLGVWNDPAVRPHHAAIRAGAVMIEADRKGVHLSKPGTALDTDRAVVLRPRIRDGRRREAARELFAHVGTGFDFLFDNSEDERLYCVELAMHAIPEIGVPADQVYGRMTFLPDKVAAAGAAGTLGASFVLYVRTDAARWETASAAALAADVEAAWQ